MTTNWEVWLVFGGTVLAAFIFGINTGLWLATRQIQKWRGAGIHCWRCKGLGFENPRHHDH